MTKPPIQKPVHKDSVTTYIRIPRELHAQIQEAADRESRSLTAELLLRLQSAPWDDIKRQNEEIKSMLRLLLKRD